MNKPEINPYTNFDLFKTSELPKLEKSLTDKNYKLEQRYYIVHLYKDILDNCVLAKANGGINTERGKIVYYYCTSYEEGLTLIEEMKHIRKQRRYQLVAVKSKVN